MSEAVEKVESMEFLPVFPLPLVLLPGEMLPLHIFEPRYRQMLQDIETERNLFGVSLFEAGEGFVERPEIGSIGCVAEVREVQKMDDGRSNILTFGVIRYRIVDFVDRGTPYLTAAVEFFEDSNEDENVVAAVSAKVFELFERVAKAAFDLSGNRGKFPEIQRSNPEHLSFVVAAAFNLENQVKYELLEMNDTLPRLERLKIILEAAVDRMEDSAAIHKAAQTNGHSKKQIDL